MPNEEMPEEREEEAREISKDMKDEVEHHLSSESSDKEVNCEDAKKEHEVDPSNELIGPPTTGMIFSSFDELVLYYANYGRQEGFGVRRTAIKSNIDETKKFATISCARSGKPESNRKNIMKPKLVTRTECKAKINATIYNDGKCKVNKVVLSHNHVLDPSKARFLRCNMMLDSNAKRRLEINGQAGISLNKNFNSFVVETGVYESVPFIEKDCRNFVDNARWLQLGCGDAEAICNYFIKMQDKNSNFFYAIDLNEDGRLRNVFWADARSRAAYEAFGDVVTFDTTYITNKYDIPFAPLVGVNHHGQSILFGCALVSNENIETFVWIFEKWLACMSGRTPNSIITDQDKVIQSAIERVFPGIRHRWCLWHIMKKIPEKLKGYSQYESIKTTMQDVVYNCVTIDEFEEKWKLMVEKHSLQNDKWLDGLYNERHRWVPVFVKDTFWAGMSTTQRSESIKAFFDGYVNSKTTLKQFVEQYDNILRRKVENEAQADYDSFNSWRPCITKYDIERQFQEAYTNSKFKEVQEEVRAKIYCAVQFVREEGAVSTFEVLEEEESCERKNGIVYNVYFNEEECEVKCMCRLFEFRGILCRHAIALLVHKKIKLVSSKYILARWRKDLKRAYTNVQISYDDWNAKPEGKRYNRMCDVFYEVADMASKSDERCNMVVNLVHDIKAKLCSIEDGCGNSQSTQGASLSIENVNESSQQSRMVHSPLPTHRHGHPPTKRKVSKCELEVKKKRGRKKKKVAKESSQNEVNTTYVNNGSLPALYPSWMYNENPSQASTYGYPNQFCASGYVGNQPHIVQLHLLQAQERYKRLISPPSNGRGPLP